MFHNQFPKSVSGATSIILLNFNMFRIKKREQSTSLTLFEVLGITLVA